MKWLLGAAAALCVLASVPPGWASLYLFSLQLPQDVATYGVWHRVEILGVLYTWPAAPAVAIALLAGALGFAIAAFRVPRRVKPERSEGAR